MTAPLEVDADRQPFGETVTQIITSPLSLTWQGRGAKVSQAILSIGSTIPLNRVRKPVARFTDKMRPRYTS